MKRSTKKAPRFQLVSCNAALSEIRARIPFRYGNACLTAAPLLLAHVRIADEDGNTASGLAADCLPPLWFDKNPNKSYRQNVADQITAYRKAKEIYLLLGDKLQTAASLWSEAYPRVLEEADASDLNALTASFGSSFFERAVIDALCRLRGVGFFAALKSNLLGIDTAAILPDRPLDVVACRHTIGLADPLTEGEIPPDEVLDDGLPQALETDIEFYGLRYFKVKVSGDTGADVERLSRIAALLNQRCREGYHISLDGNEQYTSVDELRRLLESLKSRPYGNEFYDRILFIEQPLRRDLALDPAVSRGIEALSAEKPVTIDESDDRPGSFENAIALGYRGTSHKNCKGIFRSLLNRQRIVELNRERGENVYFQTAEDLANVSVVPLQEDLASICALGIDHAERNGHHYFRGLDHLPREEAEGALAAHSDLYEARQDSVFLRVVDGVIVCTSINEAVGYGYACDIHFGERTPIDEWRYEMLGLTD